MEVDKISIKSVLIFIFSSPSLLLLLFASLYRNSGGYVWAYQANNYFSNVKNQSKKQIAQYLGWIPATSGSIGCLIGGILGDKIIKNKPSWFRIWILVIANILSFPFSTGTLLLKPPLCYFSLFIMYNEYKIQFFFNRLYFVFLKNKNEF